MDNCASCCSLIPFIDNSCLPGAAYNLFQDFYVLPVNIHSWVSIVHMSSYSLQECKVSLFLMMNY